MAILPSGLRRRGKEEEVKLEEIFFGKMPEVTGRIRESKVLIFNVVSRVPG